jgi:hypothetical protein
VETVWTEEVTRRRLVEAYAAAPWLPVRTAMTGDIVLRVHGRPPVYNLLAAAYWCLGQDKTEAAREARVMMLAWAQRQAVTGGGDASLRELCREFGWSWSTFHRRVEAAVLRLTGCLVCITRGIVAFPLDGETNGQ